MTTNAVNANAINEVSFPGSQDGLSLVQLVGTIVVTCSISSISLVLTASAAQAPEARCGVSAFTIRSQIGASTESSASSLATSVVQARLGASTTSSASENAVPAGLKISLAAQSSGVVTQTAQANIHTFRSAPTTGSGSGAVAANKYVYVLAASTPSSTSSATALRKLLFAAPAPASADSSVAITFQRRVSAAATPAADDYASEYLARQIGADAVASALSAAGIQLRILSGTDPMVASALVTVDALNLAALSASTQSVMGAEANITMRSNLSASTVASAASQAGVDAIHTVTPEPQPASAITSTPMALTAFNALAASTPSVVSTASAAIRMHFAGATAALANPGVATGQLLLSPVVAATCEATGQVSIEAICNTYPEAISGVAAVSAPVIQINRLASATQAAQAITAASLQINTLVSASGEAIVVSPPTPVQFIHQPAAYTTAEAAISLVEDVRHTATPDPMIAQAVVSTPSVNVLLTKLASTVASVATVVNERMIINWPSASTTATATLSAQEDVKHTASPDPIVARAVVSTPLVNYKMPGSASTIAKASGSAVMGIYLRISGATTAEAIVSSVAIDYAATATAPGERQMFVTASDRYMEVQI